MRFLIPMLLIYLLSTANAEESIYTWKDKQGYTHYSNKLPADKQAQEVDLGPRFKMFPPTGQVYTWKDEQGRTHYGDHPPGDRQFEPFDRDANPLSTIQVTPPPSSNPKYPSEP